jgi:hypothetical protein
MTLDEIFAIKNEAKFRKTFKAWREKRHSKLGYDRLSEGEQRLVRIQGFVWEVNGNAFQGFFDNAHGALAHEIHADLRLIGAKNAAALLKRATSAFPSGKVPPDAEARQDSLERALKKKSVAKLFEEINSEFTASDPDRLSDLVWQYVRQHRGHFDLAEQPQPEPKPRIKFGKPKRTTKLKDYLEYPIWMSAEDVQGAGPGWERPVVSPKFDVSEELLQHAKKACDCPFILFKFESFDGHGIGQWNYEDDCLINIFLWDQGKWLDLDELGGLNRPFTFVAVPSIRGQRNVRLVLKKGKLFAVRAKP